jgi:uncharacterized protein
MTAANRETIRVRPADATALIVLAHGAGAGMRHVFMETMAGALAERRIATLRYEFSYMAAGRKRPDTAAVLEETVRAAVERAVAEGLPTFAGGKSMGGRMTSRAQAVAALPGVRGLVLVGFPLHRPGDASDERAEHLAGVTVPMLFLQGTRDQLAELSRMKRVVGRLGRGGGGGGGGGRARMHVVEGADHGFAVRGRKAAEVMAELADVIAGFVEEVLASATGEPSSESEAETETEAEAKPKPKPKP